MQYRGVFRNGSTCATKYKNPTLILAALSLTPQTKIYFNVRGIIKINTTASYDFRCLSSW